MLSKTFIALLTFPIFLSATTDTEADKLCGKRHYRISGRLEANYFSQGGAHMPYQPTIPVALPNYSLVVVRINDATQMPELVDTVTSDAAGYFSIKLPPGKYGFVKMGDLEKMTPGQCMPTDIITESEFNRSSSTWESNQLCPLDLTYGSIDSLVLVNHQTNICGMCP